jgi:hypothetical protein
MDNVDSGCECENCDMTEDCAPVKKLRNELKEQRIAAALAMCDGFDAALKENTYD